MYLSRYANTFPLVRKNYFLFLNYEKFSLMISFEKIPWHFKSMKDMIIDKQGVCLRCNTTYFFNMHTYINRCQERKHLAYVESIFFNNDQIIRGKMKHWIYSRSGQRGICLEYCLVSPTPAWSCRRTYVYEECVGTTYNPWLLTEWSLQPRIKGWSS